MSYNCPPKYFSSWCGRVCARTSAQVTSGYKHPDLGRAFSEHAQRVANQRNKRIVSELAAPPRDTEHSQEGASASGNLLDIPPGQSAAEHVIA